MTTNPKPIAYVDLGGQSRPVRFGFNALATFGDLAGVTLADLAETFTPPKGLSKAEREAWQPPLRPGQLLAFVYAGLDDGARKEGTPRDFTPEDVGDWLDEAPPDTLTSVFSAFAEAQGEAPEGEPGKGKAKSPR